MRKVKELGDITGAVSSYMNKGVLTNNFIMPEKYQTYINSGTLYFEETGKLLVVLIDFQNHWRVYYHIRERDGEIELPKDKPSVIELVYKTQNEALSDQLVYWEGRGFKPYISRARMNGSASAIIEKTGKTGHNLKYSEADTADEIQQIISEAFDPYLGCVPSINEVREYIRNKEIIVVQAQEGKILGVLHTGSKNNTNFVWHLVVTPEARGRGLAKSLLNYYARSIEVNNKNCNDVTIQTRNARIQLWVKKDNVGARALYEAAGFTYDGWESIGLVNYHM